jgi:hypothetical protein
MSRWNRGVVTVLAVAVATLAFGNGARAAFANATFGYVPFGSTTFTGANLGSATSITIPGLELVNNLPPMFLGNPNNFNGGPNGFSLASTVTVNPLTLNPMFIGDGIFHNLNLPNYATFAGGGGGSTPANRYTFSVTSIRWDSSNPNEIDFIALGIFHDSNGTFANDSADISGSFTTTGVGNPPTVNTSFTFETPTTITTGAPEPATVTLLGFGAVVSLVGYGVRRRKLAAAARAQVN